MAGVTVAETTAGLLIKVSARIGDDFDPEARPWWVRSSNIPGTETTLDDTWGPELRRRVAKRRREGGAVRGRVLYVISGDGPAALATLHVPSDGPICVMDLGFSSRLPRERGEQAAELLFRAAATASTLAGRDECRLGWICNRTEQINLAASLRFLRAKTRHPTSGDYFERAVP